MTVVFDPRKVEVRQIAAVVDDALGVRVGEADARVGRVLERRLAPGRVPELEHARRCYPARPASPVRSPRPSPRAPRRAPHPWVGSGAFHPPPAIEATAL